MSNSFVTGSKQYIFEETQPEPQRIMTGEETIIRRSGDEKITITQKYDAPAYLYVTMRYICGSVDEMEVWLQEFNDAMAEAFKIARIRAVKPD